MPRNLSRFCLTLVVLLTTASATAQAPPPSGWTLEAVGFVQRDAGAQTLGAFLLLGVPLDAWLRGGGAARALTEGAAALVPVVTAPAIAPALTPRVARQVVAAAWRTAGVGADDGRLDAMLTRARWSALLPEVRLRVVRSDRRTDATGEDARTSDTWGATQWYEARATFRLDRLLYADEEPQVERLRLDRQEARARVAAKVLAELSKWARAQAEEAVAPLDSDARLDALLKVMESELTLDVMTGGWFSAWRAERADR